MNSLKYKVKEIWLLQKNKRWRIKHIVELTSPLHLLILFLQSCSNYPKKKQLKMYSVRRNCFIFPVVILEKIPLFSISPTLRKRATSVNVEKVTQALKSKAQNCMKGCKKFQWKTDCVIPSLCVWFVTDRFSFSAATSRPQHGANNTWLA